MINNGPLVSPRLELGGAKASPAVLAYAIGVYLNIFLTLLLTLLGGFIFHTLTASLLCFALFSVIRLFSGGYHLQSLTACTLVRAARHPHTALFIPAGSDSLPELPCQLDFIFVIGTANGS